MLFLSRFLTGVSALSAHEEVSRYSYISILNQHKLITFFFVWNRKYQKILLGITPRKTSQLLPRNSQTGLPRMFHFRCVHVFILLCFFPPCQLMYHLKLPWVQAELILLLWSSVWMHWLPVDGHWDYTFKGSFCLFHFFPAVFVSLPPSPSLTEALHFYCPP